MFLWFPVLDLARAPRRTARKKGSGYENGALAKSKPDTIKTWYPVKHCACSTSNADKHFGFLVCFVLKVFLQENPTKAVGFANFIYLNQLVGKT